MKAPIQLKQAKSMIQNLFAKRRPGIPETLQQTNAVESKLTASVSTFEREFLQVLTTLEALHSTSEHLSKHSLTLLELSQSEDNPIRRISYKLQPNLDFIESSADAIESLIEILETNQARIDATLSFETELNHTFSQLTYIRTLFAVEAAPLEQNAKVMFTSLVEEIHRLQKDVTGIFTENFRSLKENRGTIKALSASMTTQAQNQRAIHRASQNEVDEAVKIQSEILAKDIETNSSFKNYSDQISQAIGNAIVSLQTQDIVSQKIEHILEVSDEVRTRFEGLSALRNKKDRCSELRFIEHAALLNLNQIKSIGRELRDADQSIDRSLQEIVSSIRTMENAAKRNDSSHASSDSAKGASLIAALRDAGQTVGTASDFLSRAFETIEPIRNQTTNVSGTVQRLSSELHLIGLNAEIHAARTGGSTALETLSAKTSAISVETQSLCRNISSQLDELSEALHRNVNDLDSLQAQAVEARRQILAEIPLESENLEARNAVYSHSRSEAQGLMDKLRHLTESQGDRQQVEGAMRRELEAMEAIQAELSGLAKQAADRLKVEVDVPEIMSGLLERYTMNSEKKIHLQTLGLRDSTPASVPISFDPFPAQAIELRGFDTDRKTTSSDEFLTNRNNRQKTEANLGQNVEFF